MAGTIHPRKIILIAGKTSRGPGKHEYIESVRLLKVLLVRVPALSTTPTRADRSLGLSMNKRLPERWNYVRALLRQLAKG
jgi:hypothetical protein